MGSEPSYLVDTNILLRLSRLDDPQHRLISSTVEKLVRRGTELCFSLQNIAEFWNVCTRPAERNGFGLSIVETNARAQYIESTMTFLPDSAQVYTVWRELGVKHNVCGVQVHDARLVAIMQVYRLSRILTLNQPEFLRYSGIEALHPRELQPS